MQKPFVILIGLIVSLSAQVVLGQSNQCKTSFGSYSGAEYTMYRFVIKSDSNWNNALMAGEPNFIFSIPVKSEADLYKLNSADWAELNTRSARVRNRAFRLNIDSQLSGIIDEINISTVCFYNIAMAREGSAPPPKSPPQKTKKESSEDSAKTENKGQASNKPVKALTELPPVNTSFPGQCSAGVVNANIPGNSVVNAHNLSVAETIPLVGVPFYLSYSSDRYLKAANFNKNRAQFGGWSLSLYHFYDSTAKILYLGDGGVRNVEASPFADGKSFYIASANRPEAYILNSEGIHQQTINTITGKMLYGFQYDSNLRLSMVTDQFGNKITIQYSDKVADIAGQGGQHNIVSFDNSGMLAKVVLPSQATYQMVYDKSSRILSFQKPTGEISSFSYDANGRLVKDEGSGGNSLALANSFDSSKATQLSTVTTSLGRVTSYSTVFVAGATMSTAVSSNGGISKSTSMREASGYVDMYGSSFQAKYAADPRFGWQMPYETSTNFKTLNGEINRSAEVQKDVLKSFDKDILKLMKETTKVTLQKDITRTFITEYDGGKKQFSFLTPMKRKTVVQSNEASQVLAVQVSGMEAVRFTYDQKGQLSQITQGAKSQSYEYDQYGNVVKNVDAAGISTGFKYDVDNNLIEKNFADGKSISFGYDKAGNLTSITPPGKPQHSFVRGAFQFVSEYLPPSLGARFTGSTKYSYNTDKQLTGISLADGSAVDLNYDKATGLLNSILTSDGATSITYRAKTDLVDSVVTADGSTLSYKYVGNYPLAVETKGQINSLFKIQYSTDATVNQIEVSGADKKATKISFAYDKDGLLSQAGALTLNRNEYGAITSASLEQMNESYVLDGYGLVAQTYVKNGSDTLLNTGFNRDAVGRIVGFSTQDAGGNVAAAFEYDKQGRLVKVTQNGISRLYSYDANGNRIGFSNGSIAASAVYDDQDRLLKYGNTNFTYSALGSLATRAEVDQKTGAQRLTSYNYDVFGNLKKVSLPDGRTVEYIVDGQNRRIGKKINGKLVQGFIYSNQLQVAGELDGAGNLVKTFIYGSKINIPDYVVINDTRYRIISNHVGTPIMVLEVKTGKIVERFNYDEFGNELNGKSSNIIPFGFAGGIADSDTGLVRFGARDYDSTTGRWTNKDPIGFNGGQSNLYAYVNNDPVDLIDPSGNFGIVGAFLGAAMGAVTGGVSTYAVNPNASWEQIRQSMYVGGITGASIASGGAIVAAAVEVYGLAAGGASVASAITSGIAGFTGNLLAQQVVTGKTDVNQAILSGILGGIGGAAAAALSSGFSQGIGLAIDGALNTALMPMDIGANLLLGNVCNQ